jgi:hypothetical protein
VCSSSETLSECHETELIQIEHWPEPWIAYWIVQFRCERRILSSNCSFGDSECWTFAGNILALSNISLNAGANVTGRAFGPRAATNTAYRLAGDDLSPCSILAAKGSE